jgi:hypothetical protein
MATSRLTWKDGERNTKANFRIPYVGELSVEVEAKLPDADMVERRALAIRQAQLLIRNLASELDRQAA